MDKLFEVSYSLPYRHYVTVGVSATDAADAVQKVQAAFDDGTMWDDLPNMPLLDDDFEEVGDTGEALAFDCELVEVLVVRPSVRHERRMQAARRACEALLAACAQRASPDRLEWCEVEAAYALALQACAKEPADPSGMAAPANPCANDEVAVGMPGKLVSLAGDAIQGTLESVCGVAGIISAVRKEDGSLEFDYEGGTEIIWDAQRTVKTPEGEVVFVTEDGDEIPASEVKLVSESRSSSTPAKGL